MITRILCLFMCMFVFSFVTVTDRGLAPGQPVFAGGKDPVKTDTNSTKTKPSKDKSSKKKSKKELEREKEIRGSLRAIELTLNGLDRAAKNNKLRAFLRSLSRLTSLQVGIDTMYAELDGTKHENKPQAIYDKLNGFARQKADPELRENARNLLQAIAASRYFGRALAAREAYKKAKKAQDYNEMADQQNEYEDARGDFHRKADKLPRDIRNKLFFKLPREIE